MFLIEKLPCLKHNYAMTSFSLLAKTKITKNFKYWSVIAYTLDKVETNVEVDQMNRSKFTSFDF